MQLLVLEVAKEGSRRGEGLGQVEVARGVQ